MVTREEMLKMSLVSGDPEKELSSIYQVGEDAPFITLSMECGGVGTIICC